ncbi:APC family permease [Bacillus sp. FJAT-29814]|uniref:APC family permease n=1 Tax=Bacillus sp. FJAT-29814 TaxID=1729688 RepID=UPI0009E7C736|nr:APC family permease [Bacillus sp. FJAT-29814]
MSSQESKLKKVLGLGDLMGIAVGQIIGAGVMALTGIAIGMTGSGVTLAFILSSIFTLFLVIPIAVMGSAIPTTGGLYRYTSRLLSPKIGFFMLALFTLAQLSIAMYAISFAEYVQGLVPSAPLKLVAFTLLTVFFIANLVGVKTAAIVEKIMVVVLLLALIVFVVWGMPEVNYQVFNAKDLFPGGFAGFFMAVGLLSFATGGAQVIAELGGEIKNPGRDIPLTIITTTIGVGILYAFMATIAVAVLPIADVANKPLTDVARTIMPEPLFIFFMVGGAMFALATTLNATLSWVTKGLMIASEDGWLPKSLGKVNNKYGTPHWLLTLFYVIGAIPILTGMSLAVVSALGTGVFLIYSVITVFAATKLPKKYPVLYQKAPFKLPPLVLNLVVYIAMALLAFQAYLLMSSLSFKIILGTFAYMVAAVIYVNVVGNNPKFGIKKEMDFFEDNPKDNISA